MNQIDYISAGDLAQLIQAKEVSCVAALEHFIDRTQAHNETLNAIVATDYDTARERAKAADAALAKGENWGALHGVPMTIKDSYEVVGMPTTSGAPELQQYQSENNALAVQALIDAGANIFGKTNLSMYAGDLQSYNDIYGTTNNPWDVTLTPGGSSGGAAAAVAAGMTPIELGSDIGGSIRTPAHYCGIYGHKPTHNIVSLKGHIPGRPGTLSQPDLAVAGPLATSAGDLRLLLDLLIKTPASPNTAGWQLKLPKPQRKGIKSLRVAYWFDDDRCAINSEMRQQFTSMIDGIRETGAQVSEQLPAGYKLDEIMKVYLPLLTSMLGAGVPPKVYKRLPMMAKLTRLQRKVKGLLSEDILGFLDGMTLSHRDWLDASEKRTKMQHEVANWFTNYDILLMPVAPTSAIKHNQKGEMIMRTMQVNGEKRSYLDLLPWVSLATTLGLPATSAPIGTVNGLPTNVQIVGPAFSDYTTIAFAEQLQEIVGGFTPPPL